MKSLKVVVPILMLPACAGDRRARHPQVPDGLAFGVGSLARRAVVFVLASFLGTVPINIGVNDWDPADPPSDWKRVVARWERIDVLRSSAAVAAFVTSTIGIVLSGSP